MRVGNKWRGIFILAFLTSACATPFVPRSNNLPAKTFVYPASDQELWEATLGTLKLERVPTADENFSHGTIRTKRFPIQKAEFEKWVKRAPVARSGFGTLYLRVLSSDQNVAKLEITPDFRGAPGAFAKEGKRKVSTGLFEQALAARIHAFLVEKKYPTLPQLAIGCDFEWDEVKKRYRVSKIKQGSFGEEQGFHTGDVVQKLDRVDISIGNFFILLSEIRENTTKTFELERSGQTFELPVAIFFLRHDIPWIGMRVERDSETGDFRVEETAPSSPAGHAGIRVGDILVEEAGIPMTTWQNYYKAVTSTQLGLEREFVIQREGEVMTIVVEPKPFQVVKQ